MKMTGKQQRTFGSFYFAINQPLGLPVGERPGTDLVRLPGIPQPDMDKLPALFLRLPGCGHRSIGIGQHG